MTTAGPSLTDIAGDPSPLHVRETSLTATDTALRALRWVVLLVIVLDFVSTLIADAYGVSAGPAGPVASAQSMIGIGATAAAMWFRSRLSALLSAVAVVLALVLHPSGVEIWVLIVTGVIVCALATWQGIAILIAAQLAFGLAYAWSGEHDTWSRALVSTLAIAGISDGLGLTARRLLRARDRWFLLVRQAERGNAAIRVAERVRLAEDTREILTRTLDRIDETVQAVNRGAAPSSELRRSLLRVQELSQFLLIRLRELVDVLRTDVPAAASPTTSGPASRLDRFTRRELGLAVTAVALLLIARAFVEDLSAEPPAYVAVELVALAACAVVIWRPQIGAVVGGAAMVATLALRPSGMWDLLAVVTLGVLGAMTRLRRRDVWWMMAALLGYAGALLLTSRNSGIVHAFLAVTFGVAALLAGAFLRQLLATRIRARAELDQLLVIHGRLVANERLALARELHDVVARQLSVTSMVIMSGTVSDRRDVLLDTVDRVGRSTDEARRELQVLVAAMRGPDVGAVTSEPQGPLVRPVACARALADQLSEAGRQVEVELDAGADELAIPTQRTLTRVLQESTTNILRYAPHRARVRIALAVGPAMTSLVMVSELGASTAPSSVSSGWGLRGIRERVELSRGTFAAGPRDGTWVVDVALPHAIPAEPALSAADPFSCGLAAPAIFPKGGHSATSLAMTVGSGSRSERSVGMRIAATVRAAAAARAVAKTPQAGRNTKGRPAAGSAIAR